MQATDADLGNFSTVHYQLVSEDTAQFSVETETGIIRLEEATSDRITVITVTAFDNPDGNPSFSVHTTAIVRNYGCFQRAIILDCTLMTCGCLSIQVYVIRDEDTVTLTVRQPLDDVLASSDALQRYISLLNPVLQVL